MMSFWIFEKGRKRSKRKEKNAPPSPGVPVAMASAAALPYYGLCHSCVRDTSSRLRLSSDGPVLLQPARH